MSHYKAEAEGAARSLKEHLTRTITGFEVFLDSDNLRQLGDLAEHVRNSRVLVLLQTRNVLYRPYCILELLTAIDADIPIVAVNIVSQKWEERYDYEAIADFLLHFDQQLDTKAPGARRILEERARLVTVVH